MNLPEAIAEIERLEKLVYVPGVWKCAKCKLSLISSTLHVNAGRISANNEPQQCPNGCGPLWRKTEREAGNELIDRMDQTWNNVIERAAKECEKQIERDEAHGRLQARSILARCAASIRALTIEEATRPEALPHDNLIGKWNALTLELGTQLSPLNRVWPLVTAVADVIAADRNARRSPLGSSTACHLCEDPQQCAVNKHCAFAPCKSPFPSVSS